MAQKVLELKEKMMTKNKMSKRERTKYMKELENRDFKLKDWKFLPAFPHPADHEHMQGHDENEPREVGAVEAVCGGIDESQHVELYDGSLGVSTGFVDDHQAPVGQLQWNNDLDMKYTHPGNVSDVRWCTGTLISRDLFLTAGHCFDQSSPNSWQRPFVNGTMNIISNAEIAANMHVNFNYQRANDGSLRQEERFAITELVEYREGPLDLDFAIVRLAGNPGDDFGWAEISDTDGSVGEVIGLIQHPAGRRKMIEAGPIFHFHGDRIGYDSVDTLGGSSGSGILRKSDGKIIGVHTNGGCDQAAIGHNHGVRITSIIRESATIAGILNSHPIPTFPPLNQAFLDWLAQLFKIFESRPNVEFLSDMDELV